MCQTGKIHIYYDQRKLKTQKVLGLKHSLQLSLKAFHLTAGSEEAGVHFKKLGETSITT